MLLTKWRILETVLLLVAIASGSLLLRGVAKGAEPAGCMNKTCKEIQFWLICESNTGTANKFKDCLICATADGRCNGGTAASGCNPSNTTIQWLAKCDVTAVCTCGAGTPAATNVEATGTLPTGGFSETAVKVYNCPAGSGTQ